MTFDEAMVEAMLAPLASTSQCMCQCNGGGLSRFSEGEYHILPMQPKLIPLCEVHGVPAYRRWWQSQGGAERARYVLAARTL